MASQTGPLFLEPRLDERLWGGNRLAPLLGLEGAPAKLAEVWQVYEDNRVAQGPFAGRTLREVCELAGPSLLGSDVERRYGRCFPLLTKLIDAAADLSLQVHPDDAYARRLDPNAFGKSEAWYFLDCAPGATLIHGFSRALTRERFRQMISDGTLLEAVRRIPVSAGQALFVPAGTLHAITAGVLLFEVQQRSDATYRVYDYDRVDSNGKRRPLHVEQALDVLSFAPHGPSAVDAAGGSASMVRCDHFELERLQLTGTMARRTDPRSFEILVPVDAEVGLQWGGGQAALRRGGSVVLPADLGGYRLESPGRATLLRCTVPPGKGPGR